MVWTMSAFVIGASAPAAAQPRTELPAVVVEEEDEGEVRWDPRWRRAQTWEYVLTPSVLTSGFVVRFFGPKPDANMGVGPLDRRIQRRLSIPSEGYADVMRPLGDAAFFGLMAYRLFDDVLTGIVHDWDVAWQLAVIDTTSLAFIGSLLWVTEMFVGRERPQTYFCARDTAYQRDADCTRDHDFRSFYSGRTAVAVASAALTCLHHARLPLYGGGAGDAVACGGALALATLTTVSRSTLDRHWFSDQLVGIGIGLVGGWLFPVAVHYRFGTGRGFIGRRPPPVTVLPDVSPQSQGLRLLGLF
jgi:membrane-associated phospholipid phosphatase